MGTRSDWPIEGLKGVGPRRREILAAHGIATISELLSVLPAFWEDRRRVVRLDELEPGEGRTVEVLLRSPRLIFTRRRSRLVRAEARQGESKLSVLWFNRPYLVAQIEARTGAWILHGDVRSRDGSLEMVNPSLTPASAEARGIEPVYRPLGELPAGVLRQLVRAALEAIGDEPLDDPLPVHLRRRYGLPDRRQAFFDLHLPEDSASADDLNAGSSPAHQRLVYGELLALRLEVERSRAQRLRLGKGRDYGLSTVVRQEILASLPFLPTAAQVRVAQEIFDDLDRPAPMQRLLQGDVASGKTAVAHLALTAACRAGYQAAFVAPTELLAEQHHGTLRGLMAGDVRIGLYTGSSGASLEELERGSCQLAVGTHALLADRVRFARLGVAVIDEQQRFGVEQRRSLLHRSAAGVPDLLIMTATPIPRSLALTQHGDLDLSVLDELPPGRQPVETRVLPASRRQAVYRALARRLAEGERAYVVLPFIARAADMEVASLDSEGREIAASLGPENCAVVHGRMSRDRRQQAMESFASGRRRVLLATSLIEVGVDVPEASLMVIESAERFGLAQLHQLRGRIGRGTTPGRCIALHADDLGEAGEARLAAFAATQDGFAIAEADLEIRGEGDLLGSRQAGRPAFAASRLARDPLWLQRAADDARELLANAREIPVSAPAGDPAGIDSGGEANGRR